MRRFLHATCVAALLALGPTALLAGDAEMHVSRVALFSSGVAYYECDATVNDDAVAELTFRTDQINDIIKSLMVQDLGGGRVGTVGYASQDPVEKALKSFGVDITGKPTLGQLLDQLRGEPVQIAGKRAAKGTILGVERQKLVQDKGVIEQDMLNVLTDGGVMQIAIAEIEGLKLLNEKIDGELRKALATLAGSRDAGKKSVTLRFDGKGQRKVRAAYLLEAPIWKTSYRLVIGPEGKPMLQGWATVENATEEDWKDVNLSLVSGRPISFRMDLYTPLYIPRPREELELYASLRPPEYAGAIGDRGGAPPPPPAAPAATGAPGGARGRALAKKADAKMEQNDEAGRRSVSAGFSGAGSEGEDLATFGAGVESVAKADAAGELFEYKINVPVSIARQHSAMLPIVNQEIEGEKVSIYNPATHPKYPLNGLQLKNTSGLNLMQGPVTLFDGNVYAGDAKLPNLKPNEQRLIGYALDLGLEVSMQPQSRGGEIVSLKINKGVLTLKHKYVDERVYAVKNKEMKARTLIIEQPYGNEWTLLEPKEPLERTADLSRFKLVCEAQKTANLTVKLEQTSDQLIGLAQINNEQIQFYLRSKVISNAVMEALQRIVSMRTQLDGQVRQREGFEKSVNEAVAEQGRVRENLKTLAAGSDPHKRQLTKFDEIETQIDGLRKQIATAREREEKMRAELEMYLSNLTLE